MVHMDHVSAVLDVDYSPTGKEFVSASFDKTIRIFPKDAGRSRLESRGQNPFFFKKRIKLILFDHACNFIDFPVNN